MNIENIKKVLATAREEDRLEAKKEIFEKLKEIIHPKGECACCDDIYEFIEDTTNSKKKNKESEKK